VTVFWHGRSAALVRERYGARVWSSTRGKPAIARRAGEVTDTFRPGDELVPGVLGLPTARAAEVVFWLAGHRTLVPGDVLLGDDAGGLRLCPDSWLPESTSPAKLADSLRPLLELPIERVLVSHGEPVLADGHAALSAALDGS
jgi:glyoxylase-like metal-dependent hydrolase (beta-lactamase superfamily II)